MSEAKESVQPFETEFITPLARQASGRENLRLAEWQVQAVPGGVEEGSVIQRITGVGEADGQPVHWSMILKTITAVPANSSDPQASHYWKREANFYQSELLKDLPAGLQAAECYGCYEQPGRVQIFLQDLPAADAGLGWAVEYYRGVARKLGQFNGAYVVGRRPIPAAPWIPRHWLRTYLEEAAPNVPKFFNNQENPILKRAFQPIPTEIIRQSWDQRHEMMDALDQLPQTFCHQDAFSLNLFANPGSPEAVPVAIDWSFSGPAALGAELVPLVCGSMMAPERIPYTQGPRLQQLVLEGYLEGLAEAGWRGNPDLVRFGYCVSAFYRYPIGMTIGAGVDYLINLAYYPFIEESWGVPIEQVADFFALGMAWHLPFYAEALRLKKALGL